MKNRMGKRKQNYVSHVNSAWSNIVFSILVKAD